MRALITGAAGQDGTILATMLARDGWQVTGLVKPGTNTDQLQRYVPGITLVNVDLADGKRLRDVIVDTNPQAIYNFGGFTAPGLSWDHPDEVQTINVEAVRVILAAIRSLPDETRFFQSSSASIFEGIDVSPQTEESEPAPNSPYARSKTDAMALVREARERDGVFAVSGIFYNHESPLRGEGFVTRKISLAVARIAAGLQDHLELGDIEVARDWGWAPDYVRAARLMLQAEQPKDYVLATGISHRLSFFIQRAFLAAGITDWQAYVRSTEANTRLVDTNLLVGDSRAAYLELGWRHTCDFDQMARVMVNHDQQLLVDPDTLWVHF